MQTNTGKKETSAMTLVSTPTQTDGIEVGRQVTTIDCLPSSARAVYLLLSDGKERTLNEIIGCVAFSPRTIRNALSRLRESGLIIAKFNFRDARKPLYRLKAI
jgi:DNA-binding transcriptional ArsR family regulator